MFAYQLLFLLSLVTYTFGALAFSVLAISFLVWGRRTAPSLTAFTAACAAAFLSNLLLWAVNMHAPGSPWTAALTLIADVATALLPPLLLHVIWRQEESGLHRAWKRLLILLYALSAGGALLRWLAPAGIVDSLEALPALLLALVGAAGLLILGLTRRTPKVHETRQRWWYRTLLAATLLTAAFSLSQAADYLLLAFFAVTLYYRERLAFFDVLIRQGAFFALGLGGLTIFFATAPSLYSRLPDDWSRPWILALLLIPLWLAAPWVHRQLSRAIDHFWLGRPFSPAEAERHFTQDVQRASTEDELRHQASASLRTIFQAEAHLRFDAASPPQCPEDGLPATISLGQRSVGWVVLQPRRNALPYLSDDHRLLASLVRTLAVVLENVRFRQERRLQQEREQELRLLASRAELRALRAQINPHFLFNALNAIAGLIPGNPALADETVQQLAQVFRYTLRKSEKEWARVDEEVEFAEAYLKIEQARFGERMRVEIDVDRAAQAFLIPSMSIQPLLENAVKHGVGAVEGPAMVALRARLQDGELAVEVFDNGPGFPRGASLSAESSGHGLRNVAQRLRGYYGDAARLWWENGSDGTRVFLTIPSQGVANG